MLLQVEPRLVRPAGPGDYSPGAGRDVGRGLVLGAADIPACALLPNVRDLVAGDAHLYEFVVPMVPPCNERDRVTMYAQVPALRANARQSRGRS